MGRDGHHGASKISMILRMEYAQRCWLERMLRIMLHLALFSGAVFVSCYWILRGGW